MQDHLMKKKDKSSLLTKVFSNYGHIPGADLEFQMIV